MECCRKYFCEKERVVHLYEYLLQYNIPISFKPIVLPDSMLVSTERSNG